MLAYRLISGESLLIPRSFCPNCKSIIVWYDNIPLVSWFFLGRKCRICSAPISWLYPFIELFAALIFFALFTLVDAHYWFSYTIFFSALLITIRTDLETMLISRFASLFLVPLGFIFSYFQLLPISFFDSLCGAITAYLWLFCIGYIFYKITKKVGIGQGDYELMALIGSFLGVIGWWITLLIGSLCASVVGLSYLLISNKSKNIKIPFGPFLASGAILFVFFKKIIFSYMLSIL